MGLERRNLAFLVPERIVNTMLFFLVSEIFATRHEFFLGTIYYTSFFTPWYKKRWWISEECMARHFFHHRNNIWQTIARPRPKKYRSQLYRCNAPYRHEHIMDNFSISSAMVGKMMNGLCRVLCWKVKTRLPNILESPYVTNEQRARLFW